MKLTLPTILSLNAGYVDTAGFLALQGLFTAHVTGNFVTMGSALAHGSSGLIAKLLALPMFCLTILLLQIITLRIAASATRTLRGILIAEILFLTAGAAAAIRFGRVENADSLPLIVTGMLLVVGMAIQNAAQKLHLGSAPPTTIMTGTTTQIMLDLGSLLSGRATESKESVLPRLMRMLWAVVAFALGCATAAVAVTQIGLQAFVLPPVFALTGLLVQEFGARS